MKTSHNIIQMLFPQRILSWFGGTRTGLDRLDLALKLGDHGFQLLNSVVKSSGFRALRPEILGIQPTISSTWVTGNRKFPSSGFLRVRLRIP